MHMMTRSGFQPLFTNRCGVPLNSADSSTIVGDGKPFFLVSFYHGVDDRLIDRLPMPFGASGEGIDVCPPLSVQMEARMRLAGQQYGVDEVVINGGTRTSGANPGKVPRSITIKVNQ